MNQPNRIGSAAALCLLLVATAAVTPTSAQAQNQQLKPMAVIALSGYDALMVDVDFVGSLAGAPGASQQAEQMLAMFTGGKGLAGLDKAQPIGAVVQSDGMSIGGGAVMLPVTDLEELLGVAAPFGVMAEDAGQGVTKIMAQGQTLFAKSEGGWAFLAPAPQMLNGAPADPATLLGGLAKEYDLAVQFNVQNVPEAYRQLAVETMSEAARQGMRQEADESDADFAEREEQMEAQLDELKSVIEDVDQVTLGVSVDAEQARTYLDFEITALPGTKLADQMAENSSPTTNFAGFFQPDAAMMMSFASKVTDADQTQMQQMFETLRMQARKAIDDEADLPNDQARNVMKEAFDDFIDAFKATIESGVMDGGAVLNLSPGALTFVAGGFVGEPSKIEDGLKKMAELAKEEEDFPGVQWNAGSHAGVEFHTMSLPIPEDEAEPRKLFGDAVEMAVGIGKESVFFAAGKDCLAATKQIIDESASNRGKPIANMEMTFALSQILEAVEPMADENA
ncbi:MAG: hypothetical protein AAF961_08985, partial [Planctomycetota bacterium]